MKFEENSFEITTAGLGVGTTGVSTTGLIRATNDVVAYYSSDERLKENIKNISSPLAKSSPNLSLIHISEPTRPY